MYFKQCHNNNNNINNTYTYNMKGSITSLRRSELSITQPNNYGVIDSLSMSYNGNQLRKITDFYLRKPL